GRASTSSIWNGPPHAVTTDRNVDANFASTGSLAAHAPGGSADASAAADGCAGVTASRLASDTVSAQMSRSLDGRCAHCDIAGGAPRSSGDTGDACTGAIASAATSASPGPGPVRTRANSLEPFMANSLIGPSAGGDPTID